MSIPIFRSHYGFANRSMSLIIGAAVLVSASVMGGDHANAQNLSGSVLDGAILDGADVRVGRVLPGFRDPALQRLGLRNRGSASRSGGSGFGRSGFGGGDVDLFDVRRDLLFVERQRELTKRNAFATRAREARRLRDSTRRIKPNGRFLTREEREAVLFGNGIGLDNNSGGAVYVGEPRRAAPCPAEFNCGYRVYSNGRGPRIITPAVPLDSDLPAFDGVSGSKIITVQ